MTPFQERVRDFLVEKASLKASMIGADTPLITSSMIDSFLIIELVAYVEEIAGVRIPDDFATPEQLDSLNKIERLKDRLKQA